jgi:hypothetical protein
VLLVPGQRTVCSILRIIALRQKRRFVACHRILNRDVRDRRMLLRPMPWAGRVWAKLAKAA